MTIYRLPADLNRIHAAPRAVALGLFDGLHIGHRTVIAEAVRLGKGHAAVYTFSPATVHTKNAAKRLVSAKEQYTVLQSIGVTEVFETDFASVCDVSPADFVETILKNQLHATAVTCGFNYRFGKGGAGDAALLCDLCAAHGISVTVVPSVTNHGQAVSSTAIRTALADGDMPTVRRMLGRGYCLSIPVEHGQHLGRQLGMPTINQPIPNDLVCPRYGVYASCVEIDGKVHTAVTNIGCRPTVGADSPLAETWIDGYHGDLYNKTINLYPVKFLRDEQPFDTLDALQNQVVCDAKQAQQVFTATPNAPIRAVLFDFDDTLHLRDHACQIAFRHFLQRHYPTIDDATLEKRLADIIAFDDYGYHRPLPYPQFIEHYLTKWDGAVYTTVADALDAFFIDFAASCIPVSGAVETLHALHKQGILLGVITNGYPLLQNNKLTFAGLHPLIDMAVVSGDEGVEKPQAEIFRRVAYRLGLSCEECLYVGDHPINDIQGARCAGMQAVRINYGFPDGHPIYDAPLPPDVQEISSLGDLLTVPGLTFAHN